jgi:hypothetical protein
VSCPERLLAKMGFEMWFTAFRPSAPISKSIPGENATPNRESYWEVKDGGSPKSPNGLSRGARCKE